MFNSLYSVYSKLKRPSTLYWLNSWSYSNNNTWLFLSNELLTFYIESLKGFKTVTVSVFQAYPQVLYKLVAFALVLIQLGFLIG